MDAETPQLYSAIQDLHVTALNTGKVVYIDSCRLPPFQSIMILESGRYCVVGV
jgi:hypothetical protein